jgi:predicted O-methyltransferase YrrM
VAGVKAGQLTTLIAQSDEFMFPRLFHALSAIDDFLTWQRRFADVEGYLHDLEGYTLLQIAATGGGVGAIVEIGSYLGRSTAFLAAGSKGAGREKVVAVDHFRGSPEHQAGQPLASPTLVREGSTFRQFQENLRRHQLDDYVTPVVSSSADAARQWVGPIRLLFIDGDHSYEQSREDFESWSPFVVPHGLICFHDITTWPGVTRFYEERVRGSAAYREVAGVVSLRVVEKQMPPAPGK